MRIGIFGGSFNPLHIGHAIVANYLSQQEILDRVWIMPSKLNPLKQDEQRPVSGDDRMQMARLVAEDCAKVDVCDIEMHLPEPSYTYTTLCELRRRYPQHSFSLIIGGDHWEIFNKWRNWKKIITEFGVIIYTRPGYEITGILPDNVALIDNGPQAFVSSSEIREELSEGKNVNFLVPDKVLEYIKDKGLYGYGE